MKRKRYPVCHECMRPLEPNDKVILTRLNHFIHIECEEDNWFGERDRGYLFKLAKKYEYLFDDFVKEFKARGYYD